MAGIDFSVLTQAIDGLNIGTGAALQFVPLLLGILCTIAITRNVHRMKILFLPVLLSWNAVDLGAGLIPGMIAAVLYISAAFGFSNVGDIISSTAERVTNAWQSGTAFVTKKDAAQREKIAIGQGVRAAARSSIISEGKKEWQRMQDQLAAMDATDAAERRVYGRKGLSLPETLSRSHENKIVDDYAQQYSPIPKKKKFEAPRAIFNK